MSSVWTPNFQCDEEHLSRSEIWDTENPSAKVTIRCKMDERYLVMADIVGNYRLWPFNTPVPLYATHSAIRLDTARKTPDPLTASRYETGYDALIDLTYTFVKGRFYTQVSSDEWPASLFADEDMEPSMQFLTDDYHKYGWGDGVITDPMVYPGTVELLKNSAGEVTGSMKSGEEPGKAVYQIVITRDVKGYRNLPTGYEPEYDDQGVILSYIPIPFEKWPGRVHNEHFNSTILSMSFDPGTLLFTQPKVTFGANLLAYNITTKKITPIGPTWRVVAKLLYQELGWNAFYVPRCDAGEDVEDPYYAMVHKGCQVDGAQPTDPKEYPRHLPYKYLDMTEFLFNSVSFPPDPWPPEP
jgi:hypothetical protein